MDPRDLIPSIVRQPQGSINGLTSTGIVGPWPCESCHELSQFADIGKRVNRIFCKNSSCHNYEHHRIIDKATMHIMEPDGSVWEFDNKGLKWQVRG